MVLILVIITFKYLIKDESVIAKLFVFAGYTYGPLLGLYAFGLFTKWQLKDKFVPLIAILSQFFLTVLAFIAQNGLALNLDFSS